MSTLAENVAAVKAASQAIDAAIREKGGTTAGGLKNAAAAISSLPPDYSRLGPFVLTGYATAIPDAAFYPSDYLTAVIIPSAKTVGEGAFSDCGRLYSVDLQAVTDIGSDAFYGCSSLGSVGFGSAKTIGSYAFAECRSLYTASFESAINISSDAFSESSLMEVFLGAYEVSGSTEDELKRNAKSLCYSWGLLNSGCKVYFKNIPNGIVID